MGADMWNAAFNTYQATEYIYHCLLPCLTLYSPKSRNTKYLRSLANDRAAELMAAWPQYKRNFELLRRAYGKERYSPGYKITREELQWLFEWIADLQNRVKHICKAHLQH